MPYAHGMPKIQDKRERLEARVPAELKENLVRAAALEQKSITDFLIEHLGKAVRETIEAHTQWQLSQADTAAFVEALLNPTPPNPKLKAAARRYRRRMGV